YVGMLGGRAHKPRVVPKGVGPGGFLGRWRKTKGKLDFGEDVIADLPPADPLHGDLALPKARPADVGVGRRRDAVGPGEVDDRLKRSDVFGRVDDGPLGDAGFVGVGAQPIAAKGPRVIPQGRGDVDTPERHLAVWAP